MNQVILIIFIRIPLPLLILMTEFASFLMNKNTSDYFFSILRYEYLTFINTYVYFWLCLFPSYEYLWLCLLLSYWHFWVCLNTCGCANFSQLICLNFFTSSFLNTSDFSYLRKFLIMFIPSINFCETLNFLISEYFFHLGWHPP